MRELLRDNDVLRDVLRRRILRAAVSAANRLDRAATGRERFDSDHQLRACVALTRLAPALVGDLVEQPNRWDTPDWYTPQRIESKERLFDNATRSDWGRWWRNVFKHHGPQPGRFQTAAEALAYGHRRFDEKHPPTTINENASFEARILNEEGSS